MSFIDMLTAILLILALVIALFSNLFNPLIRIGRQLVDTAHVNVGAYINVFQRDGDRLFIVEPDKVVMYNTAGVLYYYFEGGASRRMCPDGEQAVIKFTTNDIQSFNETGEYNISCTRINALTLIEHFSESPSIRLPMPEDQFSALDVINKIIQFGYAKINFN
ncbi:hypothetical protein [Phthorimaea operculella granulovirus]|uniref:Per os infectivity factor 4 n=1 Tax=Phthorimaea operculella granulovirus TaxID=192584 RepID=Q8JRX8_9BBAC|nr:hypothetical protein [Phthorimaea operculella granulovirus]AAM70279.1 hypothetical protein [Phthorimaea operculella granulovirus]ANY57470.1 hypothetical protein PhopGVgp081 [Phthorimaea operculella granulovirus]QBH65916.1 hypothetical protein PhopGVgp081 [Phthorimaea operculella granulovirus]QBH66046.1 hypothetical protein PhopGVgp081 [Phthorimaea operculella granulovirus]QBH66176.1 hypothetical protein PhopGVgp081 [Phthorimaea operculella granulovirus]